MVTEKIEKRLLAWFIKKIKYSCTLIPKVLIYLSRSWNTSRQNWPKMIVRIPTYFRQSGAVGNLDQEAGRGAKGGPRLSPKILGGREGGADKHGFGRTKEKKKNSITPTS
ncbi:MAG: hypothetical protein IPG22_14135 [Acidobacteria bacterium]|nr:hypothetical protein [Acidobacteriota bacterium]